MKPESRFRYDSGVLSLIREPAARDYLVTQGLPSENPLFFPVAARLHTAQSREFIVIGNDGTIGPGIYCVDVATGEVAITSPGPDERVGHVNASPRAFDRSISEFDRQCPLGDVNTSREDLESISADLGRALVAIDDSVFDEDPGFWYDLLHDVAIGDYAAV